MNTYGYKTFINVFMSIEQAVRAYIFERAVDQAKAANAHVSEADLAAIVNEAVQWARELMRVVLDTSRTASAR